MNWKVNYWTLLFALSLGALLYMRIAGPSQQTAPTPKEAAQTQIKAVPDSIALCIPDSSYAISLNEFMAGVLDYSPYSKDIPANIAAKFGIHNPDVEYFHLPRCELDQMLKDVGPKGNVYAYLAVKEMENPQTHKKEKVITLMFADAATTNVDNFPNVQVNGQAVQFFDFVNPCPTRCD